MCVYFFYLGLREYEILLDSLGVKGEKGEGGIIDRYQDKIIEQGF